MGCGRSHHQSPTKYREEQSEGEGGKKGGKGKKRQGKKKAKAGAKADTEATTSNGGGSSEVKGGLRSPTKRSRKRGIVREDRQAAGPMGAPPGAGVAPSMSSIPGTAREQPSSPLKGILSPSPQPANFPLLNGASHSRTEGASPSNALTEWQGSSGGSCLSFCGSRTKTIGVTKSQQEFFRMLDEKIERGHDYDSDDVD